MFGLSTLTIVLFSLFFFSFVSYVVAIWIKFGPQETVSETLYLLKEDNSKPWTNRLIMIFVYVIMGICFSFMVPTVIAWVACAAMVLLATAVDYRDSDTVSKIHVGGAIVCMAAGLFSLTHFGWWNLIFLGIFAIVALILYFLKVKNKIWWIEISNFLVISVELIFNIKKIDLYLNSVLNSIS